MVPPVDFGFNSQTAADNKFQTQTELEASQISEQAVVEYQDMVTQMKAAGVHVLELSPSNSAKVKTPDAVFPNNWFSTSADGDLIIYPMAAENRRREVRLHDLKVLLRTHGYTIHNYHQIVSEDGYLEGTGSLVFDHLNRMIFAAESMRCNAQLFKNYLNMFGYRGYFFRTLSTHSMPIYHTNILMSVGTKFAVVCLEAISDSRERLRVKNALASRDLIEISKVQMEQNYCGNIIELSSVSGDPIILMSKRALSGFTSSQLSTLHQYGQILSVSIPTIESVGGGSARCMVAEIFLPRSRKVEEPKN